MTTPSPPPPLLEARSVQKHFGRVVALREANFTLRPNEVHALVGDNGAGKSTLIKIISGVFPADSGEVAIDGRPVTIATPREARELGIETVYQDLALADQLDTSSNLFLGREQLRPPPLSWFGFLDKKAMRRRAQEEMRRLKVGIQSVDQPVLSLSGGQRQAVAVARAIAWGTRIVIMDEPTAALGVRESSMVLELIKEVRSQGLAVIMVSHNLPEVFAVADRITVLRNGKTIVTLDKSETSLEAIVGMMTGAVAVAA
jgi:simple sugar transport system ATP-binding protein